MQSFCCFRQPGGGAGGVGAGLHGRGEECDGSGGERRHPLLQRGQAGVTQGRQLQLSTAYVQDVSVSTDFLVLFGKKVLRYLGNRISY